MAPNSFRPPRDPILRTRRARLLALGEHFRLHHSAIGLNELAHLGIVDSAVDRLVEDGILLPAARGSFRSGLAATTPSTHLRCLLLSAGPDSVLTRVTAGHHQELLDHPPRMAQIAVPRRVSTSQRDGFLLYPATDLKVDDVHLVNGLPCTTPARTAIDLAKSTRSSADFKLLRRLVRQASQRDASLAFRLEADLRTRRSFRGRRILTAVLDAHTPSTIVQRSDLEADFLALLMRHRLPLPETNAMAHGFELDVLWREHRVYVELDTFGTHGSVDRFERDRERDAVLAVAGYRGLRVTDRRLRREPLTVVRQVRRLLNLG